MELLWCDVLGLPDTSALSHWLKCERLMCVTKIWGDNGNKLEFWEVCLKRKYECRDT